MDTDNFVLGIKTIDINRDLKSLEDIFDFSKLDENHEIFINKNKKVKAKFEIETHANIWIDEFVCLRSKMYAFKCGNDSKNKSKGVSKSQSKNIKFEEYKKRLDGEEHKKGDNYILKSINQEMIQEIKNLQYLLLMKNDVI